MSLNFTVQKITAHQGLEGEFKAQVVDVDYVKGDYGNYHTVDWKILSPSNFEGRIHQERYNTEHDNDVVREIAINNYSKFCLEIGGLKEGDEPKIGDFLYKVATIKIRKRIGKNDGKSYSNVVSMELDKPGAVNNTAETNTVMYGGIPVPNPAGSPIPINDEVPF